eukprot:381735-Rhodomonas_salina.1
MISLVSQEPDIMLVQISTTLTSAVPSPADLFAGCNFLQTSERSKGRCSERSVNTGPAGNLKCPAACGVLLHRCRLNPNLNTPLAVLSILTVQVRRAQFPVVKRHAVLFLHNFATMPQVYDLTLPEDFDGG